MIRLIFATVLSVTLIASEPNLISVGIGEFDVDPVRPHPARWIGQAPDEPKNHRATAVLIEDRPATGLVSRDGSDGWAVRGLYGVTMTDDASLYLHAGGWLDGAWGPAVFGISFGPGFWFRGRGKDLGSPLEFRSMIEAGWRSSGGWRVTLSCNHISNGGLADRNPGANTMAMQLHVPW